MYVPILNIGFTGTQEGMTSRQIEAVRELLFELPRETGSYKKLQFHHGCCIGADEQAATIARSLGYWLLGHPPKDQKKMSTIINDFDFEPEPYLERNHKIVLASKILIGAPKTHYETLRSGTWSTIRFSRSRIAHYIINP